jgi:hypothetical protein
MLDFFMSDRFFKTLEEPTIKEPPAPTEDPTAELKAQIEALKAQIEALVAPAPVPDPVPEPTPEPDPAPVPAVSEEPPTAPLSLGGELGKYLDLRTRNPRALGEYFKEHGDQIISQAKQLLEA